MDRAFNAATTASRPPTCAFLPRPLPFPAGAHGTSPSSTRAHSASGPSSAMQFTNSAAPPIAASTAVTSAVFPLPGAPEMYSTPWVSRSKKRADRRALSVAPGKRARAVGGGGRAEQRARTGVQGEEGRGGGCRGRCGERADEEL